MGKIDISKKTIYKDIGGFYTTRPTLFELSPYHVFTPDGQFVGFINTDFIQYPEDVKQLNDSGGKQWTGLMDRKERYLSLKNAVRFLYLNWGQIHQKTRADKNENKIRKTIQEILSEGGYWKNGGDEPLFPEPFSNDALGWDFMPESSMQYTTAFGADPFLPEPFSIDRLGSEVGGEMMPENKAVSKWSDSVDYPSFGVTAIRKTEEADIWTFVSSDAEFIGTYRVNPENLAKNLKRAAEKAFIKWMGLENIDVN